MPASHAPYIMPDGRSLSAVLRAEGKLSTASEKKARPRRAKDELWGLLQHTKGKASSDQELAEVRAMERAGNRRRRQWLNEKMLRDLAGPMTTHDMECQFKPVPFGMVQPPSAFTLAAAPQHAAIWDLFRSIDSDKEARVLQAWEVHNSQQRHQRQQHTSSPPTADADSPSATAVAADPPHAAAAAAALAKWARVGRRSRGALKKASLHSVMSLEVQVLELLEQEDPHAVLVLDLPDSFARLLVHGLAQFHSLRSSTCMQDGSKVVVLQQQVSSAQRSSSSSRSPVRGESMQESTAARHSPQQQQQQQQAAGTSATADWQQQRGAAAGDEDAVAHQQEEELMCSDVIAVLQFGNSLDHNSLRTYVSSLEHDDDDDDGDAAAAAAPQQHAGGGGSLADE